MPILLLPDRAGLLREERFANCSSDRSLVVNGETRIGASIMRRFFGAGPDQSSITNVLVFRDGAEPARVSPSLRRGNIEMDDHK